MSPRLVIIGARAMGREACSYARESGLEVKGFLDSDGHALEGFPGYPSILSSVEEYVPGQEDVFVCALGEPEVKRKYVEAVRARGGEFISIVHPKAYVGHNVRVGRGCIICPHSTITNDIVIGDHVIVNVNASVNHDNDIGDYSTLCPGCHLAGRVKLGKAVFLGIGTSIIPDVELGDGVFVAAGSIVTQSFSAGRLKGVPATEFWGAGVRS